MRCQVAQQAIHMGEIGAVDQIAALRLDSHQARMRQLLQMKGQRIARYTKLIGQHARRKACGANHDKSPEHPQALGMGKGAKS